MNEIKPDRNYFVGWYYAFKWIIPKITKHNLKHKRRMRLFIKGWIHFIQLKKFWYTPELIKRKHELMWEESRQQIKISREDLIDCHEEYFND
jgi:hypothetical protein